MAGRLPFCSLADTIARANSNILQGTPVMGLNCTNGLAAWLLLVSCTVAADRDWPSWMGPQHDGISTETGWTTNWSDDGLREAWQREIGIGFSSVSIADGRLFTMGHVDGREFLYCLDVTSGKTLWSYDYPCELVNNLHEGGPGATPTIDGEFVYSLGREGQLFCFRAATGELVWKKMLQEDLDVPMPEWGFTSSAYILGNQLILEAGRVVSYDKRTGSKSWQTSTHQAGYGSAALLQDGKRQLLATLDCDALRLTDASNGEELASAEWESPFRTNSTTPIIHGNLIYISSGYNVGCGLFRWTGSELEKVYSNREMRNHFNNSILYKGHLYGFDGNSNLGRVVQLKCMNLETGKVTWEQRGLGCGSLMIADGKLVLLSEKGELVIANASPDSYQELARAPFLTGRCWTVPVLLNSHVYGRNAAGTLRAVALPLR